MQRLSVVFFGSGSPASCAAFERLVEAADVRGVVAPRDPSASPLREAAARRNVPLLQQSELPSDADLFCVATFPKILPASVLALPRLGAVNLHPSLLPSHRGPDPLFWTYFYDEKETGVTVHWMTAEVDAGDIVRQARVPVTRGIPGVSLYMKLAEVGAQLLSEAVGDIASGTASRTAQDERSATSDPSPWKTAWRIPYEEWSAERLWHFLLGVVHLRFAPFEAVTSVEDFQVMQHNETPGSIKREGAFLHVYTRDGRVRLRPSPARSRIRGWLGRNLRRFYARTTRRRGAPRSTNPS